MGLSHSWIAVQAGRDAVLARLGAELGDELVREYPYKSEALAELAGGWTLVLSGRGDRALKSPLVELAALGPAVACFEEEHVMYSEARGFEGGVETWRIVRDCEQEPWLAVQAQGRPPAAFEGIRQEILTEQDAEGGRDAGVDLIFDIPPRVAQSVCGFRLGEELPDGVTLVQLRKPRGPGLLQRLFGRS